MSSQSEHGEGDQRFPAILGDDEILAGLSQSVCPDCLAVVDCQIIFRDNQVVMRKHCGAHGLFETTVYADVKDYIKADRYNKPGAKPLRYGRTVSEGCPLDCGICEAHEQHTCVGVVEITDRCNLECPVCFAGSDGKFELPLANVKKMIDTFVESEREPEVLQISGGEPTLHADIFKIINYAGERGIKYVVLNTNGVRLAERSFAEELAQSMGASGSENRPYVYLQFDGVRPGASEALRGRELIEQKMLAIENCRQFGMYVALVPTVVKGVNEDQIGEILEMALDDSNIKMVNFQPVAAVNRCDIADAQQARMTIPDVLREIEIQTLGLFKKGSFMNIPCSHPTCSVCAYVYRNDEQSFVLNDVLNMDRYLDSITNLALPHTGLTKEARKAADALLSMSAVVGSGKIEDAICTICGVTVPNIKEMVSKITMVSVHAFMDAYSFDLGRARKCCVTQILADGNMVPFCVYNVLHRRGETPTLPRPT